MGGVGPLHIYNESQVWPNRCGTKRNTIHLGQDSNHVF